MQARSDGASKRASRGFSLVELMISLLVGLLITLGAFQLFVTTKSSFYRVDEIYNRQMVMNYLVTTISQEIRIANGPVYPAVGGDAVSDSGNLLITLDEGSGLEYDPYCGAEELNAVEYYASGGEVTVAYDCSPSGKAEQVVASGVSGLHFYGDNASGASTTLDVEIAFESMEDEPDEKRNYVFKVTNRKRVIDAF